jgi:microsomal epoxide hydrolase
MDYLMELTRYWRDQFDWRAAESHINSFPQFLTNIDGLDLHFIHCRSAHVDATPLLITHGWPGSIVEFLELIPRLPDPERFGGTARDAFHVIAPSLQGYGGSPPAPGAGMSPLAIAKRHAALMARLGYERYLAQGGDWGSLVAHHTAVVDAQHCAGLHLNLLVPVPPKDVADPMTLVQEHERAWLAGVAHHADEGAGYYHIQRTRSQTLSYALTDSPVGWCAWVTEKFHGWCDCERDGKRDPRHAVSWDAMLTNISLYWYTNTIASSIRLYREQALAEHREGERPGKVGVPTGVAVYPAEIFRSPRAWAERRYPIVHWYEAPRGGHFAALEQPELFAEDLRRFRVLVFDRAAH